MAIDPNWAASVAERRDSGTLRSAAEHRPLQPDVSRRETGSAFLFSAKIVFPPPRMIGSLRFQVVVPTSVPAHLYQVVRHRRKYCDSCVMHVHVVFHCRVLGSAPAA